MLYRDFMTKFRPLYAPDDGAGAAAPDGAAAASPAAITPPAGAQDAAPAAAAPAVPGADAAPAAGDAKPADSAPTLLEEAAGKPKADGAAKVDAKPDPKADAKPGDGAEAKKDDTKVDPAPADAKPESKDAKADGDKPADDASKDKDGKADPDKKDATAAEPPAPIKYDAFKLPDGIKLDDKELSKFTEFAGKAQIPQDVAQGLVDLYVAERQNDVTQARAEQRRVWDAMNDTWKTELRNDPELGGNRLETSLSLAKAFVEEYLPDPKERAEYMAHMRNNGMGNYRLHVKLMHNAAKALNIFEDNIVPANPQAPKPSKGPGNRGWYPSMGGGSPT